MNSAAFKRAEALENLESYAKVIVIHLALVSFFPQNQAITHWQRELDAFLKILRRYDKGKKRPHNFNLELIVDTLEDEIFDNASKDSVLIAIEGHGMILPENPDFSKVLAAIKDFALKVLEK